MQSKTSFFNMTILKKNLARTWVVGLVYFIVYTIMIPFSYILTINNGYDVDVKNGYTTGYWLVNILSTASNGVAPAIFAIITLIVTFSYLYSKKDSYMIHSFPLNRTQLYFSGLVSSILVVSIPVLLVSIVTTIAAVTSGAEYVNAIWYWALVEIVSGIFFIGFGLFAMMLTGQLVTAIVFFGILNFVYIGIEGTFRLLLTTLSFGMSNCYTDMQVNALTPMAYITSNCKIDFTMNWDDDMNKILGLVVELKGANVLVGYAIAAVVFLVIAFIMYKRKKLETVNDFITIPFVKPIFSVGISFFVSVVCSLLIVTALTASFGATYNSQFVECIISTLILGVIFYYVTLMLIAKSVRVFKMQNAIYCGIYSVCALAVLLCVRFDALGIVNKVPAQSEIVWAGIDATNTFVFTEADEVEKIIDIHNSILDNQQEIREMAFYRNNNEDEEDPIDGVYTTIKYQLTNGKTITRAYYMQDPNQIGSGEYAAVVENELAFMNRPEIIKKHVIGPWYQNSDVTELSFSTVVWDEEAGYYTCEYQEPNFESKDEKLAAYEDIYKAMLKDIDAGKLYVSKMNWDTADSDLYNDLSFTLKSKSTPYLQDSDIMYSWGNDTPQMERYLYTTLNRNCSNTLAALKRHGFYIDDSQIVDYGEVHEKEQW